MGILGKLAPPLQLLENISVEPFHRVTAIESVDPGSPLSVKVSWNCRPPPSEIGLSGLVTSVRLPLPLKSPRPQQVALGGPAQANDGGGGSAVLRDVPDVSLPALLICSGWRVSRG